MTLLRGITLLDFIDEIPAEALGVLPAEIAGLLESLSLVEHKSATSGRYYVHFGVVQSAKDIGLSLDQNFPIEIPGLQNGLRFTFATRRTPPGADPNSLEPEPANWQLDILLDRFAIAFPVLYPASLAEGGPSEPAHLVRSSAPGPSKIYGKGVLRIESVDGAVHFNIVTHADPFRPDGPLGAVLEVGLSPEYAVFSKDDSSGVGIGLGPITIDDTPDYTPAEIMARGHGPEWTGLGVKHASVFLPRNLPGLGDVSFGVTDLLIGTSSPGGVQLETYLQFGQAADSVGGLQFFQDLNGTPSELGSPGGIGSQRTLTLHTGTEETVRIMVRTNGAVNARWKRPGDSGWSSGQTTGWFTVRVGGGDDGVLRYRDLSEVTEDGNTHQAEGQEILFSFVRPEGESSTPGLPPTISVSSGSTTWENVAQIAGSPEALGRLTFSAVADGLDDAGRAALTWELRHAGNTLTEQGGSFQPELNWQTGSHDLVLSDTADHHRRIRVVVEEGGILVGTRAGVFRLESSGSVAATPTAIVANHRLPPFHQGGSLDARGEAATLEGGNLSVPGGALAEVSLEPASGEPGEASPTPDLNAHVFIRLDYTDTVIDPGNQFIEYFGGPTNPFGFPPVAENDTAQLRDPTTVPQPGTSERAGRQQPATRDAVREWLSRVAPPGGTTHFVVVGRACDLTQPDARDPQRINQRYAHERAEAGHALLVDLGIPPERISARGEQDSDFTAPLPADPASYVDGSGHSSLAARTPPGTWRVTTLYPERSGWGDDRSREERRMSRGIDIYALVPQSETTALPPQPRPADPAARRTLVPGADSTTQPTPRSTDRNLDYRVDIRAKWDSPTWVDERDSLPVLVQFTLDWTTTTMAVPNPPPGTATSDDAEDWPRAPITPVNTDGSSRDNFRFIARFTHDPRSGEASFSASLDSPGDDNGLLKFTSADSDDDPALQAVEKVLATALAFGPALLADVPTASEETVAVKLTALIAAITAATALDLVDEGTVILHRVEIESLLRTLDSIDNSRWRLMCDYVVELKCSAEALGIQSEDAIKIRYKNVGIEVDTAKEDAEKFNFIFEAADFEVVNPGKWKIDGVLGELLGITAVRLGSGSMWFELDLEFALDLGIIEISRATVRITLSGGSIQVDLRGLAANVNVPGTIKGGGSLAIAGEDLSASLDLTIIPADIRAFASLTMKGGMTHLEAGLIFATAIPLGGTGFGLYGFVGRFVSNGTRNLSDLGSDPVEKELAWHRRQVTDKYQFLDSQYAIGLGVVVGTMPDSGFTFNALGMLTFEFPDPSVVLTIDAKFLATPTSDAKEEAESSDGDSLSFKLLGVIAFSEQGLALGIAGRLEVPEVLIAQIPFAAWFPFQSGGPPGYLRVGSDAHKGRAGGPISVKILPKIFDLEAWAFNMVEEKDLLELGRHPEFNFYGFSIGFGAGFSLRWGDDAIYLEVSASILAGFGTRPFTLMAGIFLKGELWLLIVGISASAELILMLSEDAWDLRGKACGKISLFFFTIEGCVEFRIGSEPALPNPPKPPLISGVQLSNHLCQVVGDALPVPSGGPLPALEEANSGWPDSTVVLHFDHTVLVALKEEGDPLAKPTPPAVGAGWVGTERLKYAYRLRDIELLDASGAPAEVLDSKGEPIPRSEWPSAWWMPAFRAGYPEDGEPPAGEHEGWDLGFLKRDLAPWARAVPRGGEGLASDPALVLPRVCDDPPTPSRHCVYGWLAHRTGFDQLKLFGPQTGQLPYPSNFHVKGEEIWGPWDLETLGDVLRIAGLTLAPGEKTEMDGIGAVVANDSILGGYRLPYISKAGSLIASIGFRGIYQGPVMDAELLLAVCIDVPRDKGTLVDRQTCVDFVGLAPRRKLGLTFSHKGLQFRSDKELSIQDFFPRQAPDQVPELRFAGSVDIQLPRVAHQVSVEAVWDYEFVTHLTVTATDSSGRTVDTVQGGTFGQRSTLLVKGENIAQVRVACSYAGGDAVLTKVCFAEKVVGDNKVWASRVLGHLVGNEHATFALTNKALNVDRQPALPRVWGLPMEGEKQEWRGVPVGLTLTDTSLCLLLRFDDGDASRVWNGFEIEPYPNAKLTLVSNCAISRKAWLDAQEDDANREQAQDALNDAANGGQDDRMVVLNASTTYQVRATYDMAIWIGQEQGEKPLPAHDINWDAADPSAQGLFEIELNRQETYCFRTSAPGRILAEATTPGSPPTEGAIRLLALQDQKVFHPSAVARYLRGFDPDLDGAHHFLDDALWVHFDVEWVETLLARYGYALELTIKRTDPPPQPEGAAPYPLAAEFTVQWRPLLLAMQELADRRLHLALEQAPCVDPTPSGASGAIFAKLDPRAKYDIVVSAVAEAERHEIRRGHFRTSRYRDVDALLGAMGFTVTSRDGLPVTGRSPNPLLAFDQITEATAPHDPMLEEDTALDEALRTLGMDPWPLPSSPGAVLIWRLTDSGFALVGLLLDSDESMMRPSLPARLLHPQLDEEDVPAPPPPPPEPPPRMQIVALELSGEGGVNVGMVPVRSNSAGTRVLLAPSAPIDLSTATGLLARLVINERALDETDPTGYRPVVLIADRAVGSAPAVVTEDAI